MGHRVNVRLISGQRQLFLDDGMVEMFSSLKRTMHPAQKRGAVIRGPQTRSAPNWDPKRKKYLELTLGGLYESADGRHWRFVSETKPFRVDCLVYEPADRGREYKGLVGVEGGVLPAISANGVTFKKLDVPVIPSGDEYNLSFDAENHRFIATVKQRGPFGRAVFLATSSDFTTWTKPELIFHADETDQTLGKKAIRRCFADPTRQHPSYNRPGDYNVDVYNMGIFRYEGLYIGMPAMFHHTGKVDKNWPGFEKMNLSAEALALVRRHGDYTGFHPVQLACSRDLKTWHRLGDRRPFLDISPLGAGAYDIQTLMPPSAPLVMGEELWFYYTGAKHYENAYAFEPDAVATCLAVLRRDGFVSLDAGEREGSVTTRPFTALDGDLHLNVDARGGRVTVQVLNAKRQSIAGFEKSEPITGDRPDTAIKWPNGEFRTLAGKKVSLSVRLTKSQLYSFWIQ